jgi:predicted transcriptional regulator
MIRIDRAGQSSKRYGGASGARLVEADGRCPLWRLHHAFDRAGQIMAQLVELEDGARWFTQARTVAPASGGVGAGPDAVTAEFAVGIGVAVEQAGQLAAARGLDLGAAATPIGLGCRECLRGDCSQRSAPPRGRTLIVDERERGASALTFAGVS